MNKWCKTVQFFRVFWFVLVFSGAKFFMKQVNIGKYHSLQLAKFQQRSHLSLVMCFETIFAWDSFFQDQSVPFFICTQTSMSSCRFQTNQPGQRACSWLADTLGLWWSSVLSIECPVAGLPVRPRPKFVHSSAETPGAFKSLCLSISTKFNVIHYLYDV